MGIVPTLVIGVGEIGDKVIYRLTGKYENSLPAIFRFIHIGTFFTDPIDEPTFGDNSEKPTDPIPTVIEQTEVEEGDDVVAKVVGDDESITTFFLPLGHPDELTRAECRKAFLEDVDDFVDLLRDSIGEILAPVNITAATADGFEVDPNTPDVHIVSSCYAPLGSAIFFDISQLLHYLFAQAGINQYHIVGHLVLPESLTADQNKQSQANAFAALKELDHFTHIGSWNFQYSYHLNVVTQRKPMDLIFLIGGRNEQGTMLQSLSQRADLISGFLYLAITFAQPLYQRSGDVLATVRLSRLIENKLTAYSSYGMFSLVFLTDRIIRKCALKLGIQMLGYEGLLKGLGPIPSTQRDEFRAQTDRDVLNQLNLFLSDARDDSAQLLFELIDQRLRAEQVRVNLDFSAERCFRAKEMIAEALDEDIQNHEKAKGTSAEKGIAENARRILLNVRHRLDDIFYDVVDGSKHSLYYAETLFSNLKERLKEERDRVTQEIGELSGSKSKSKTESDGLKDRFKDAVENFTTPIFQSRISARRAKGFIKWRAWVYLALLILLEGLAIFQLPKITRYIDIFGIFSELREYTIAVLALCIVCLLGYRVLYNNRLVRRYFIPRTNCISALKKYYQHDFDERRARAAEKWYSQLLNGVEEQDGFIDEKLNALESLKGLLESSVSDFQAQLDKLNETQPSFDFQEDVSSDIDEREYYEQYVPDVQGHLEEMFDAVGGLSTWSERKPEELKLKIPEFCKTRFSGIRDDSIDRVLERNQKQIPISRHILQLRHRSVPFCRYVEAKMGLGREIDENEIFALTGNVHAALGPELDARYGALNQWANTNDQHTITLLKIKHGFPLFSLAMIELYRRSYQEVIAEGESLDALPGAEAFDDVMPATLLERELAPKRWLAIGLALGVIQAQDGDLFLVSGSEKNRLAADKKEAWEVISEGMMNPVKSLVTSEIEERGNEQAIQALRDYLETEEDLDKDEIEEINRYIQSLEGIGY